MNCSEAIKIIISNSRDEDVCLFTTGLISRRAFAIKNRQANFYILGSMGLVSSLGLGIALNTNRKVIIFDGDGSILMDMGTMAMIAYYKPKNLFHIVLDNEAYESTGGQLTISDRIDLMAVAQAAGYKHVLKFVKKQYLKDRYRRISDIAGPVFIIIKILDKEINNVSRVSISPQVLTKRIKNELSVIRYD